MKTLTFWRPKKIKINGILWEKQKFQNVSAYIFPVYLAGWVGIRWVQLLRIGGDGFLDYQVRQKSKGSSEAKNEYNFFKSDPLPQITPQFFRSKAALRKHLYSYFFCRRLNKCEMPFNIGFTHRVRSLGVVSRLETHIEGHIKLVYIKFFHFSYIYFQSKCV